MIKPSLLRFLTVLGLITVTATAVAGVGSSKQSVDFHDIHRDGRVAIIGHFGIPIGKTVTVEGALAKPSKVSNDVTLHFTKVNGAAVEEDKKWGSYIQVSNVDALPKDETIVVEGYEFLSWRGSAEANWHLEVEFVITKVISPSNLKPNQWTPQ